MLPRHLQGIFLPQSREAQALTPENSLREDIVNLINVSGTNFWNSFVIIVKSLLENHRSKNFK